MASTIRSVMVTMSAVGALPCMDTPRSDQQTHREDAQDDHGGVLRESHEIPCGTVAAACWPSLPEGAEGQPPAGPLHGPGRAASGSPGP